MADVNGVHLARLSRCDASLQPDGDGVPQIELTWDTPENGVSLTRADLKTLLAALERVTAPAPPSINKTDDPTLQLVAEVGQLLHNQPAGVIVNALTSLVSWALVHLGDPRVPVDDRVTWFAQDLRGQLRVAALRGATRAVNADLPPAAPES